MSSDEVWIDSLESDGISGATALGDLNEIDWNSPLKRLKHFLDSNDFIVDTTRLNKLADYAYRDLRKTRFLRTQRGLVNLLNKDIHSMSNSPVLINGEGYYYAQINDDGTFSGLDIGCEYWRIDTTDRSVLEQLKIQWKEKYHPMPLCFVVKDQQLYLLYTRSVQYAPFLEECRVIIDRVIQ